MTNHPASCASTASFTTSPRSLRCAIATACALTVACAAVGQGNAQSVVDENAVRLAGLTADVNRQFIIGPDVADAIGYRVTWQARVPVQNRELRFAGALESDIFALETNNAISRLRPSDGGTLWRAEIANPVDIFRGATMVDVPVTVEHGKRPVIEQRLFLSTDTECFEIDVNSGSMIDKQRFVKLPASPPLAVGPYLIYGTIGGQVVWHHCVAGHELRANSLDSAARDRPVRLGDTVIAASERGMVLAMDAESARTRWTSRTFGAVNASPAVGSGMVFVPSEDQYLWAFDGRDGALKWRYFTESPLTTSPFAVDDSVLQYVPDEGVVCLAAHANGKIDGVVRWKQPDVVGVPIGAINGNVFLWDKDGHVLSVLDAARGTVVSRHSLPQVDEVTMVRTGAFKHDLLGRAKDGRVVRLTPKHPVIEPPPPAPAAKTPVPPLAPVSKDNPA